MSCFFFKQKTAYEMRISDWSSDVCSSDLSLCQVARLFHERHGKVVTVTRHTANPLRAHADLSLLVSAHDERAHIEPLLYQAALQQLLDLIFQLLCEDEGRLQQLAVKIGRAHV